MGALVTIWIIGMVIAFFYFKSQRVDHPRLSAIFWPVVGGVLLVGALGNPNSTIGRAASGGSNSGRDSVGAAPPPPTDTEIERPKYGLIDSGDE